MVCTRLSDYRELIPEFFSFPTFLENVNGFDLGHARGERVDSVVLPAWAESAMDFIYTNRKALESDFVSRNLHHWIDLIWGYQQQGEEAIQARNTFDPSLYESIWTPQARNNPAQRSMIETVLQHCGHIPAQLFLEPHEAKEIFPIAEVTFPHMHKVFEGIKTGWYRGRNSRGFQSVILDHHGRLWNVVLHADASVVVPVANIAKTKVGKSASICIIRGHERLLAVLPSGRFVEVSEYSEQFYEGHSGRVNCFAVCDDRMVTGGADTITNIWEVGRYGSPLFSVTSYREEIVSCALSKEFWLAASATRDGSIFLISVTTGVVKRVIDIAPAVPLLVAVTNGWGFVVVHSMLIEKGITSFFLSVYTVNGEFIRQRPVKSEITCWSHWTSRAGFDYFVAAGSEGDVCTFEAFYLDLELTVVPRTVRIVAVQYAPADQVLAVFAEGELLLYSSREMSMERFNRNVFGRSQDGST
jgi:hypothetical protein